MKNRGRGRPLSRPRVEATWADKMTTAASPPISTRAAQPVTTTSSASVSLKPSAVRNAVPPMSTFRNAAMTISPGNYKINDWSKVTSQLMQLSETSTPRSRSRLKWPIGALLALPRHAERQAGEVSGEKSEDQGPSQLTASRLILSEPCDARHARLP